MTSGSEEPLKGASAFQNFIWIENGNRNVHGVRTGSGGWQKLTAEDAAADVQLQFLAEAIGLGLAGGAAGVQLAAAGAAMFRDSLGLPMAISPQIVAIATAFAATVRLVFGDYPARHASQLDPIDALRVESPGLRGDSRVTGLHRLPWIQVATGLLPVGAVVLFLNSPARAQEPAGATLQAAQTSFAHRLVQKTLAAHPETDEIGIAAVESRGCTVVGSTDPSDVGEACEQDDAAPIKTGQASVGKEGGEFDVSVPLHDQVGRPVGALTTRFKKAAGQTGAGVTRLATGLADEMAKPIPSKAALLGR